MLSGTCTTPVTISVLPLCEQALEVDLEADHEQQQRQAEVRDRVDARAILHRLEPGGAEQHPGAEQGRDRGDLELGEHDGEQRRDHEAEPEIGDERRDMASGGQRDER
jgi:hypothetical protein